MMSPKDVSACSTSQPIVTKCQRRLVDVGNTEITEIRTKIKRNGKGFVFTDVILSNGAKDAANEER